MGCELYYQRHEHRLGSLSLRRWNEVRRLLPLLVNFVNEAMADEVRDLMVSSSGASEPQCSPPEQLPPEVRPLALADMMSEDRLSQNEIYIDKAEEWDRLFAWCDFLAKREGVVYELYRPLVETIRPCLQGMTGRAGMQE